MLIQSSHFFTQVVANHDALLYAQTVPLISGMAGLYVYRSTALPKCDSWYKPVNKFLDTRPSKMLWSEVVEDENMMFGEAEQSLYLIEENN